MLGGEGLVLGAATGLGVWAVQQWPGKRGLGIAAAAGGLSGIAIALAGGRLMSGSLVLLAQRFPASRLHPEQIGALFGETTFGPVANAVTAGMEGLLFASFVAAAMTIARRQAEITK